MATTELFENPEDHDEIAALYVRLFRPIRATAVLLLGQRGIDCPHEVDDLVQRAFVRIARALLRRAKDGDPLGEKEARAYARAAVRNQVNDVGRMIERRAQSSLETALQALEQAHAGAGPYTSAVCRELMDHSMQQVERELATLQPRDRQVIELRYLGGLSSGEIVEAMKVDGEPMRGCANRVQVRATLYNAMERLRKNLGPQRAVLEDYLRENA